MLLALKLRQFRLLTANTFLDIIRQPIILLLTVTALGLTSLLPVVSVFMFGEEARLVRDGAFAFQFGMGLLLAGCAASVALYREISRGTVATVLCKPVSRTLFFLSKYGGILLVLAMFSVLSMLTTLLSVRLPLPGLQTDWRVGALLYAVIPAAFALAGVMNFARQRPFVSGAFLFLLPCLVAALLAAAALAAHPAGSQAGGCPYCALAAAQAGGEAPGHCSAFGSLLEWRLAPAGILIFMALAVLAALALGLSTRLPPVFTLAVCGVLFFLGLLADYLFGAGPERSWAAAVGHGLLPNWQNFWLVDALAGEGGIAWGYVAGAGAYAVLLIAGLLCFGLVSFRDVEIH